MAQKTERMTWRGFLRSRRSDPGARLMWMIGGLLPSETADCIERDLANERIDAASYRNRIIDLDRLSAIWHTPAGLFFNGHPSEDWIALPGGSWQRREHHGSDHSYTHPITRSEIYTARRRA